MKPPPIPAGKEAETSLFSAPAKWERSAFSHSSGTIQVNTDCLQFIPGRISVHGEGATIPIDAIDKVGLGDNFLFRGVVKVYLNRDICDRTKYVFFLGGKRRHFLAACAELGISTA